MKATDPSKLERIITLSFLHIVLGSLIHRTFLGLVCGWLTRVRCWELSDRSQAILCGHRDNERSVTSNAVLGSIVSSMARGMP